MDLKNRPIWLLPLIAAAVSLIAVFAVLALRDSGGAQTAPGGVRTSGEATIGGPFELVAHTGETVTEADFLGRPMLIYFGFTYCPDICPMSLQIMGSALERMDAEDAAVFQPILISVDPERDTPESLADYVQSPAFPEGLIGLTGTVEQVRAAADAYRVYYVKVEDQDTVADYLVDHSSIIYLMDANGRFVEVFTHGTDPAIIAARLERFIEEGGARS
ncbi:MAG: SCO family protein [Pseudomonadota bacterium]